MMYLSTLLIDVGSNPDRPRPGRLWLRNLYRVHQRLSMAFPSDSRKSDDVDFLKPFKPEDFDNQLHVPRTSNCGFLFRIDPQPGGRAVILVQSGVEPDWDYAFHNSGHLLAARPECKSFDPLFEPGQRLMFRLLANPVRRVSPRSLDYAGKPFDQSWEGHHVPVPTAGLGKWLERRAQPDGFDPSNAGVGQPRPGFRLAEITGVQGGYVYVNKTMNKECGRRLRSARYEGILEVTDADHFRNTVINGIGRGKAFGFGLLSIAPVPHGLKGGSP